MQGDAANFQHDSTYTSSYSYLANIFSRYGATSYITRTMTDMNLLIYEDKISATGMSFSLSSMTTSSNKYSANLRASTTNSVETAT